MKSAALKIIWWVFLITIGIFELMFVLLVGIKEVIIFIFKELPRELKTLLETMKLQEILSRKPSNLYPNNKKNDSLRDLA